MYKLDLRKVYEASIELQEVSSSLLAFKEKGKEMWKINRVLLLLLLVKLLVFSVPIHGGSSLDHNVIRKPYIVYMGDVPEEATTTGVEHSHHDLLAAVIRDEGIARGAMIYSYGKSFNGFTANLLPEEADALRGRDGIISVFPSRKRKLLTTRSWDFVGMPLGVKRNVAVESDIIIGVLDSGIYVDAPSFRDTGFGPIPSKWKGKCSKGANFTGCNRKVIGARYFNLEHFSPVDSSPVDDDGHGTHTASTAAGAIVKDASLYGVGAGTARGGVPSARIAIYKVCWTEMCSDVDLLAGFDAAIADGVDIISVSIGGSSGAYFQDTIAIGSFHAMKKGILTSCAGGNSGPTEFTIENVAPWITTVAASSTNRKFVTKVKLGNGRTLSGTSINTFSPKKTMYPLTSGSKAANSSTYGNASVCDYGSLSEDMVKGRVVYCWDYSGQDYTIAELGGVGLISSSDIMSDTAFTTMIAESTLNVKDGWAVDKYINSTKNATAVIYKTTTAKMVAPFIASFSSRGPQIVSRQILKPDIAAPGLDILAGYSKLPSVTGDATDTRHATFNILSGTSMACPHVAAAAAYVKSFRPSWSPAAIKSALMTTATPMRIDDGLHELSAGSGQINPVKAVHPGLVYDITYTSYLRFLCKEGYNSTDIGMLTGSKKKFNCSSLKPAKGADGLNYPSMHIQLENATSGISAVFHRTVTNVEAQNTTYKAVVRAPKGISIEVIPDVLKFGKGQRRSFKVVVKGSATTKKRDIMSGSVEWTDSRHRVKSPVLVYIGRYMYEGS